MEPIRCLLVDDERIARVLLKDLLAAYPRFTVVAEAADIEQAAQAVRRHHPELIFLDIQMPGGNGFQLLRNLMPDPPCVVFVTAYDRYALRAFEVNAIDYLLKPIDPARFEIAIRRMERRVREPEAVETHPAVLPTLRPDDSVLIQAGQSGCFVRLDQILYITSERNYSIAMTADRQKFIVRQTLENWMSRLPADTFVQTDRTCIVNLRRITKTDFSSHCVIVRFDAPGPDLELGRSSSQKLRQTLTQQ